MPQAIERLLATPMIKPRLPRIRPEASAIILPSPEFGPTPSYGIGYGPSSMARSLQSHALTRITDGDWHMEHCAHMEYVARGVGFAMNASPSRRPPRHRGRPREEKQGEHVSPGYRGDDPGAAALCAGSHARCRDRRRPGAGHAGAGAALGASVPRRRRAQLALHDPDQSQPQPPALAGAAADTRRSRTTTRRTRPGPKPAGATSNARWRCWSTSSARRCCWSCSKA
jgi:hypothetical protein